MAVAPPPAEIEPERVRADLAGKTLQQKVDLFRTEVVSQKTNKNAAQLLREYFEPTEMSNLWNKLKRVLNGVQAAPQTKDEWGRICTLNHREGKTELKNEALMMQLAYPPPGRTSGSWRPGRS